MCIGTGSLEKTGPNFHRLSKLLLPSMQSANTSEQLASGCFKLNIGLSPAGLDCFLRVAQNEKRGHTVNQGNQEVW